MGTGGREMRVLSMRLVLLLLVCSPAAASNQMSVDALASRAEGLAWNAVASFASTLSEVEARSIPVEATNQAEPLQPTVHAEKVKGTPPTVSLQVPDGVESPAISHLASERHSSSHQAQRDPKAEAAAAMKSIEAYEAKLNQPVDRSKSSRRILTAAAKRVDTAALVEQATERKADSDLTQYFLTNAAGYSADGASVVTSLAAQGLVADESPHDSSPAHTVSSTAKEAVSSKHTKEAASSKHKAASGSAHGAANDVKS